VYEYGSYGDLLRLWVTPDMMQSYALLDMLDKANGSTVHDSMARWFVVNAVEGGANALNTHVSNPWSYGSIDGILYFLMMDPATPAAPDPRPSLPSTFWDPGAARLISHTSWTATGTMFDYRASWISINHQNGDGGQFELYRNGEWLTKEMSNYDNNAVGLTTVYHNTLALQNWSANGTPNLAWFEGGEWANGSQWNLAENAGDPTTVMSQGTGYTYLSSDLTKLYNKPDIYTPAAGATDITEATRSLVWLLNDFVIVYDRATSTHSGLFKRFNLSLVTNPTISGHTATETMASGQKLYIQTLLPTSPSITTINGAVNLNPIAALEPTKYVMTVQDPSLPTDTRFLHVLQGANPGVAMTAATRVQSTAGAAFDGVSIGSYLIYFPVNSGTVAGTTLTAPAVSHTAIVTGLAASTAYTVTVSVNGTGHSIAIAPGAGSTSDAAGVLRVTF